MIIKIIISCHLFCRPSWAHHHHHPSFLPSSLPWRDRRRRCPLSPLSSASSPPPPCPSPRSPSASAPSDPPLSNQPLPPNNKQRDQLNLDSISYRNFRSGIRSGKKKKGKVCCKYQIYLRRPRLPSASSSRRSWSTPSAPLSAAVPKRRNRIPIDISTQNLIDGCEIN
ncbi:unnamed protein product [Linum tenue]|uniref:Uncharacterized protein n=1 Tax=Linum tenue TaxID=586396 RepID=A0AAV0J0C8_9ROSI|nr:unnamed protein product [Linum tenue]